MDDEADVGEAREEEVAMTRPLHRERRASGGAAARARAEAQRAARARAAALGELADRWARTAASREKAARRRDDQIRSASERAESRYREALAVAEKTEEEIMRDAFELEGVTTSEIATWLAMPSRRVNAWRRQLTDREPAGDDQPE